MNASFRSPALYKHARDRFPFISPALIDLAIDRLARFELFSPEDYGELNPEARHSDLAACEHALLLGSAQARPLFRRPAVARMLGAFAAERAGTLDCDAKETDEAQGTGEQKSWGDGVSILVSSRGNIFMRDIAEDLSADLNSVGVKTAIQDENSSVGSAFQLRVVVAPHEFFTLGEGRKWMTETIVSSSFMYNTEQLQTPWFARALPALLMSRGILDLCPQVARLFASIGLPALHFEPSARPQRCALDEADEEHPLFDALPPSARHRPCGSDAWADRAIDVSFFGTESARRNAFFGRSASRLSRLASFIYCRRGAHGPIHERSRHHALTRMATHVAGHSKISLNIHRDEFPYFEWHRMVRQGMASGALVVTDPCLPHPDFRPGEHFFEQEARHLPDLLEWLLFSSEGHGEARGVLRRVGDLLRDEGRSRRKKLALLSFLARH